MKNHHILVFGYFGYNTNQLDGQTVKTRDICRLLKEQYGDGNVDIFDSQDFQFSKKSIFKLFKKLIRCDILVYLPAHNNLKFIFPFIWTLSKIARFDIQYFVIGGWLSDFIKPLPVHQKMLKDLKGIHVETKKLKANLEREYGFNNVDIFPNFRFFEIKETSDKTYAANSGLVKVAFISRVEQSKGLDTLKDVFQTAKEKGDDNKFIIDFYGPQTDGYFESDLSGVPIYSYKGKLNPEDVMGTLAKYDALIFPSHYDGEGCPGILIEALAAAVPVIVSDWKYNGEFVTQGENGFICPVHDANAYMGMKTKRATV